MGSDIDVVNAARISFDKQVTELTAKDEKLIKYLAEHKHMSPFEHCVLSVKIECPLYIRSQIHRHRTFSYNEISRRYTDKNLEFYLPDTLRKQHESNRQASGEDIDKPLSDVLLSEIALHHEQALAFHQRLLAAGLSREQARGVLPQNLMTEFIMTGNLRNWAHFVKLREHEGAQQEVQLIAQQVKAILLAKFGAAAKELLK